MSRALSPIPDGSSIVDKFGSITVFFRLRWQELIDAFGDVPVAGSVQRTGQTAALVTTAVYTTVAAGFYRISYYMRKTVADGVSSSLTATVGWTETGVPLSESAAPLTTDTTAAQQSGTKVVWADAGTDITIAFAYASNTPAKMTWRANVAVESLI